MGSRIGTTRDLGVEDAYQVNLGKGSHYAVAKLHGIGTREEQQDAFGISDNTLESTKGMLFVLSDGMGGMEDGAQCSMRAVVSCLKQFEEENERMNEELLKDIAFEANEVVRSYLEESNSTGGCTLVVAWVGGKNALWLTIGDSRIYHYQKQCLFQMNIEHNYGFLLSKKVAEGEITEEEASRDPQRHALISYLGMDDDLLIDTGRLRLEAGERLLLASDGIFGTLAERQMADAMSYPVEETMRRFDMLISTIKKPYQDNFTALCVEKKEKQKKKRLFSFKKQANQKVKRR